VVSIKFKTQKDILSVDFYVSRMIIYYFPLKIEDL